MDITHDIDSIEFGIFSAEEIKGMAVCKVDNSKPTGPGSLYDTRMGKIIENDEPCPTCDLKKNCPGHFGYIELTEPVLHPMFYKMIATFLKCFCKSCHRILLNADQIELFGIKKLSGERRFNKILEKLEKNDICAHCSAPQPKILYKSKDGTISMEHKTMKKQEGEEGAKKRGKKKEEKVSIELNFEDVKRIFDDVNGEDVAILGFDPSRVHPKDLVLSVLPVIPPCSRPFVISDGKMCDDDLTFMYGEIIKHNNSLATFDEKAPLQQTMKKGKKKKTVDKDQIRRTIRFKIQTLFDNSKGKAKHPTDNRPLKGFKERLGGKDGRIRHNLMGKRTNHSARTVIGADTRLSLDQMGMPLDVAKIHTKTEIVREYNIEWLTELVNTGKANFHTIKKADGTTTRHNLAYSRFKKGTELIMGDIIVRGDGECRMNKEGKLLVETFPENVQKIYVETGREEFLPGDRLIRNGVYFEANPKETRKIKLNIGDTVERHLQEGDIVLLNRQPTLHRGSMMALEVKPMKNKTFRFNLAGAKSWNADFDGDEMNVHTPQCYESEAELRIISDIKKQIITAQESTPIINITQDSLVAMYLMTLKNPGISQTIFNDLCVCGKKVNGLPLWDEGRVARVKKVLKTHGKTPEIFNARGIISLILPESLNYRIENKAHPKEPCVLIRQGVFLEGAFDKKTLGGSHGSLIQILAKEYSPKIIANFIDNVQFISNTWLATYGFSIGLEDCMVSSQQSVLAIRDILTQCYTKAEGIETTTQNPGIREVRVTAALSQARDVGMRIAKEAMRPDNNFIVTTNSGAKGDYFNIAQLVGLLGQQNLENKRVEYHLNNGKRSLPHYPISEKIDKEREYESRGFIRHSFIHGLTPEEFFFHSMSGREGVTDTAMGKMLALVVC
jgi:DNA-directed RNA polymerase beta' subunit